MATRWTIRQDEVLIQCRCAGFIVEVIAERLGRSSAAIRCRTSRLVTAGAIRRRANCWYRRDPMWREILFGLHGTPTPRKKFSSAA